MATSAWLEVASLRKQVQKDAGEGMAAMERPPAPAPVQTVSSFSDPFAGHSPKHVAKAAPEPAAEVVEVGAHASAASAAASAPATDPFAGMSPAEAEGRRNKDLYDRLKEDIEKSRTTFQKRYGSTAAASGDYFQKEVLRSLAEDDLSVMGANFRR